MAMIVTVQDDQDPYGRTGRATQREDGSWDIEYLRPGGLDSTRPEHGDLIGTHSMYEWIDPADAAALAPDQEMPRLLDQDEADVALFMCEMLADPANFGGIFPEPGYQRNRAHAVAD